MDDRDWHNEETFYKIGHIFSKHSRKLDGFVVLSSTLKGC